MITLPTAGRGRRSAEAEAILPAITPADIVPRVIHVLKSLSRRGYSSRLPEAFGMPEFSLHQFIG